METLIAALTLGFLGSFHCIGMCGPIALALPIGQVSSIQRFLLGLVYNMGRILTYSAMGFVFGVLGKGFVIGGMQQFLSIALGVLILISLIWPAQLGSKIGLTNIITRFVTKCKDLLRSLFGKQGYASLFSIGVINGLLPCGLVYLGVAGAVATTEPLKGAMFMALFGLGTVPAMLSMTYAGHLITANWRSKIRKAVPVFAGTMAVFLILRGLNLGIPYLSPELSKTDCTKQNCCHKK